MMQETHWSESGTFTVGSYHAVGSAGPDKYDGLLALVRSDIAAPDDVRFTEVVPGRVLHTRVHSRLQTWDL